MLQPVEQLSDDEVAPEVTPMKRPAGKPLVSPKTSGPKAKPRPTAKASPKAKGSRGMKRPAANAEVSHDEDGSPEPVLKKPAAKTNPQAVKIYKYLYKSTGVWGFKKNGKEVLRVPQLHLIQKKLYLSRVWGSQHLILLPLRRIPRKVCHQRNWKKSQNLGLYLLAMIGSGFQKKTVFPFSYRFHHPFRSPSGSYESGADPNRWKH